VTGQEGHDLAGDRGGATGGWIGEELQAVPAAEAAGEDEQGPRTRRGRRRRRPGPTSVVTAAR
jgi:hypothetical protein